MPASEEIMTYPIDYRNTGLFPELVLNFLQHAPDLANLITAFPTLDAFKQQIELKKKNPVQREVLVNALLSQYQKSGIADEATISTIELLRNENTYTVTTGQQIVLFTGPLYFPFKIASTINLARQLKSKYAEYNFIPVFWMATDDHDFEEINHVNIFNQKLTWQTSAGGPVGRLRPKGIEQLIKQTEELTRKSEWIENLRKAYSLPTLADATRFLVHQLFGNEGIVIIDGDDRELKKLFSDVMFRDITEEVSFSEVTRQNKRLETHYKVQVNPREINFFYQTNEFRSRITKTNANWHTENELKRWTLNELKTEIQAIPEAFSPNVLMRPLYQETILPNLAYVGGSAEVAYWLQLKSTFDAFALSYPLLLLRNHAVFLNRVQHYQFKNARITTEMLFNPVDHVLKNYVLTQSDFDLTLSTEHQALDKLISKLYIEAEKINGSLPKSVTAKGIHLHRLIDQLSTKFIRAHKKNSIEFRNRLENLHNAVFPNGKLQERHENITALFHTYNKDTLLKMLIESFDPFKKELFVFAE